MTLITALMPSQLLGRVFMSQTIPWDHLHVSIASYYIKTTTALPLQLTLL